MTPARPDTRRAAVALAAALGLGACVTPAEPRPAGLPLGPAALANGTYIVGIPGGLDTVTLSGGHHRDPESGRETLLLPVSAWGDLARDDRREAAAVVATRIPGRGVLHELVIVTDAGGRPVQVAHQYLGDRVDVEGLSIADREVTVQMQIHGPDDPACCPTQRVTRKYSVQ
jgi:hypothetical protein